jgi:membrane protease YdiL (CAAX protease family)
MAELINNIISTVLQIIIFALIPFFFFLFRKDRSVSFFKYIGLYKPTGKSVLYVLIATLLFLIAGIGLIFIDDSIRQIALSPNSVTGKLRLMGLNTTTILTLLIIAMFKTSFTEEILFRGFIAKQLIHKFGFKIGNIIQAVIFGLIHLLLFWLLTKTTIIPLTFIFLFSSSAGWTMGYIKEKYANGSIIPGWVAHGLGNALSYYIIAFIM